MHKQTIQIAKLRKLHAITLSHRQHPAVWCSFMFFFYTKNRAFIKTGSVSRAVETLPNQQGSEKTGLEPAAAACDGLSEAARPRSQPPVSGTFLGQGQEQRGIEGLIQLRLLNVYFIAWFLGTGRFTHLILLCCMWTNSVSETNLLHVRCWFIPSMLLLCFHKITQPNQISLWSSSYM